MPYFDPLNTAPSDCVPMEQSIKHVTLAQAYVPYQFLCETYDCQTGLAKGTIFPELYKPMRSQYR